MRILLTGAAGQLGQAFLERAIADVVPATRDGALPNGVAMDLSRPSACAEVAARVRPDVIVHGGAMTNVDGCERDPALAWTVNAEATGALAGAARDVGARFVYVSTDYVFDGMRGNYREDDATNPLSAYGRSKLGGEQEAAGKAPLLIARTSGVFSPYKQNFVIWLVKELEAGRRVRIVEDQWLNPTSAEDLADQVIALVAARAEGVYHTAGATGLSRLEAARVISRVFGLDGALIDPVKNADMTWLAPRPRDSTLDTSKVFKYKPPLPFEAAVERLRARMRPDASKEP